VSLSKNKGLVGDTTPPKRQIYYSQAEYYFDCTKAWKDVECYDDDQRFASFQMSWRARLRRVYAPSFGNQLVGLATSALLSGGNISDFVAGQVSNNPQARKAADKVGKLRNSSLGSHATGTDLGNVADDALNFLNGGNKPIH
ncbi:MAG TPA: hypothetical protein VNO21_14120, partial [Polyangiaceae bacterium]|nr:hypothetical protein [Polyangiaceae bacterium]